MVLRPYLNTENMKLLTGSKSVSSSHVHFSCFVISLYHVARNKQELNYSDFVLLKERLEVQSMSQKLKVFLVMSHIKFVLLVRKNAKEYSPEHDANEEHSGQGFS